VKRLAVDVRVPCDHGTLRVLWDRLRRRPHPTTHREWPDTIRARLVNNEPVNTRFTITVSDDEGWLYLWDEDDG